MNWGGIGAKRKVCTTSSQKAGCSKALIMREVGMFTLTVSPPSMVELDVPTEDGMSTMLRDMLLNSSSRTLCLCVALFLLAVHHFQATTRKMTSNTAAPRYVMEGRWTLMKEDELSSVTSTFAESACTGPRDVDLHIMISLI